MAPALRIELRPEDLESPALTVMQHRNIFIEKIYFFTFYIYYIIFFIKSQIFSFSKKNWKGTDFFYFLNVLFPFLFLYGFIISKNFEFVKYSLPLSKLSIFFSEPCVFAFNVDYLFISHFWRKLINYIIFVSNNNLR